MSRTFANRKRLKQIQGTLSSIDYELGFEYYIHIFQNYEPQYFIVDLDQKSYSFDQKPEKKHSKSRNLFAGFIYAKWSEDVEFIK